MPKRRSLIVPVSTSTATSIAAPASMFTPAKITVSSQFDAESREEGQPEAVGGREAEPGEDEEQDAEDLRGAHPVVGVARGDDGLGRGIDLPGPAPGAGGPANDEVAVGRGDLGPHAASTRKRRCTIQSSATMPSELPANQKQPQPASKISSNASREMPA